MTHQREDRAEFEDRQNARPWPPESGGDTRRARKLHQLIQSFPKHHTRVAPETPAMARRGSRVWHCMYRVGQTEELRGNAACA